MSALSPLQPWDKNVSMTRDLARAKRFRNPGTFHKFARDAWACLQGDTEACTGPKREAFARAILGDPDAVTLDRHMWRILGESRESISKKVYALYADWVRDVARDVGETPRDFQAILWLQQRDYP